MVCGTCGRSCEKEKAIVRNMMKNVCGSEGVRLFDVEGGRAECRRRVGVF